VTQHNIRQLKKLNQVVFPVSYNDKFYKDVLEAGAQIQNVLNAIFYCSILQWHCCRRCLLSDWHDWKLEALVHHDSGLLRRIQKTGNRHQDGWTCPQFCWRRWKFWQYFLVSCTHSCVLIKIFNLLIFQFQTRSGKQRKRHWVLQEIWIWNCWNEGTLLQKNWACWCACSAENFERAKWSCSSQT
jgi:hypothetical protein